MAGVFSKKVEAASFGIGAVFEEVADIAHLNGASFQFKKSGAGTGTAKFQYSNDKVTWFDVPTAQFPLASAAVGAADPTSVMLHVDGIYANHLKVTYTNGVAVSTISGQWFGKPY
jgi:hypothetical protein